MKKKFLLQIRDVRTLIIEMLFPIIFIFAGLALATIKPIREGQPRLMSPSTFPAPSHLYYNDKIPAAHVGGADAASIIKDSFYDEFFDMREAVPIDVSQPTNYTKMVSILDDKMYADKSKVSNGFFGNYFLYDMDETVKEKIKYSVFALINATS